MHSNFVPLLELKEGLFFSRSHKGISHYDNAYILHPIDAEFRNEDHVIFVEWEFALEVVLKEVDCNLDSAETLFSLS
jgi:hypothetical protein